jgi:hypothetical protein
VFLFIDGEVCDIRFVYFPLLAVSMRQWYKHSKEIVGDISSPTVLLVSGKGKPIDFEASDQDNSTEYTGKVLEQFILRHSASLYGKFQVRLIHSNTNLFRYDENIVFVKHELIPIINELRAPILSKYKENWRKQMRITLSFADGSSARVSAINQALKYYQ